MPVYEYKCEKCGRVYSRYYPINSKVKKIYCEDTKCNGNANKIMSVNSFRIKGYSYKNGYSKGE